MKVPGTRNENSQGHNSTLFNPGILLILRRQQQDVQDEELLHDEGVWNTQSRCQQQKTSPTKIFSTMKVPGTSDEKTTEATPARCFNTDVAASLLGPFRLTLWLTLLKHQYQKRLP